MAQPRLGSTAIGILLAVGALVCYMVFRLYSAWVDDGKNRRKSGQRPTTDAPRGIRGVDPEEFERRDRE